MLTGAKVRASKPREKPYKLTDERGLMLPERPAEWRSLVAPPLPLQRPREDDLARHLSRHFACDRAREA